MIAHYELDKHEFMMGRADDALILVGQHGVYCSSARNPAVPALDLQAVPTNIHGAKELVASVMEPRRLDQENAK